MRGSGGGGGEDDVRGLLLIDVYDFLMMMGLGL